MDFRKILTATAALVLVFAAASCKKEEEKVEYDNLQGRPSFQLPAYVKPGDTFTLEPNEVKRKADDTSTDGIGYSWSVSPIKTKSDTVRKETDPAGVKPTFVLTIPDTLCTITVSCSAFATGYYSSSASCTAVIVKPTGADRSLQGVRYQDENKCVTDARDSKKYMYTTVAGLDWFIENLAFEGAGAPYSNAEAMADIFGQYYTWNEAKTACPAGWRLPSNADFLALHNSITKETATDAFSTFNGSVGAMMADAYLNGEQLWEFWPGMNISNSTCLSFLPAGYAVRKDDDGYADFSGYLKYFTCWTADEADSEKSYYRYIYCDKPDMLVGYGSKDNFLSPVRCVRDAE